MQGSAGSTECCRRKRRRKRCCFTSGLVKAMQRQNSYRLNGGRKTHSCFFSLLTSFLTCVLRRVRCACVGVHVSFFFALTHAGCADSNLRSILRLVVCLSLTESCYINIIIIILSVTQSSLFPLYFSSFRTQMCCI